jgi:hypothetical protein
LNNGMVELRFGWMKATGGMAARVLGGLAAGIMVLVLLVPRSVCACITADMMFNIVFGVVPSDTDAPTIRAAVLTRLPVGTPLASVEEAVVTLKSSAEDEVACDTSSGGATIACQILIETSVGGIHKVSVHLDFIFTAGRLSDVHANKTRAFFGLQV